MLPTRNLDYHLPEDLIATAPAEPRDAARLLIVDRAGPRSDDAPIAAETTVAELASFVDPGSVMVFNATRVLPARIVGTRDGTGGRMEALFLAEAGHFASDAPSDPTREASSRAGSAITAERPDSDRFWRCLVRGKRPRPGVALAPIRRDGVRSDVRLVLHERCEDEPGAWIVRVERSTPGHDSIDLLHEIGRTPLPPYILKSRADRGIDVPDEDDESRYQTVYARDERADDGRSAPGVTGASLDEDDHEVAADDGVIGSVAAPTAGLHFTPELLSRLAARGVERVDVTLHVGTGTFRPVEVEFVEDHPMHAEWCSMSRAAIDAVRRARAQGRPVIAVGTTSARTLESYALEIERRAAALASAGADTRADAIEPPRFLSTRLLITPGYRWRWCDGLFTNFHLPRSTLMAMVASRLDPESTEVGQPDQPDGASAGLARLLSVYRTAVERRLRFYSFGDAMFVRPARAR